MTKKVSFRDNVSSTTISNIDVSLTSPINTSREEKDNVVGILRVKRAPYTDYATEIQTIASENIISISLAPPYERLPREQTSKDDENKPPDETARPEEKLPGKEIPSAPDRSPTQTPSKTPSPKARPSTPLQDKSQVKQTSINEKYPARPLSGTGRASPEKPSTVKTSTEVHAQAASNTAVKGHAFSPPVTEDRPVIAPDHKHTAAKSNTIHKNIFFRQKSDSRGTCSNIRCVQSRVKGTENGRTFSPSPQKKFNESLQSQHPVYNSNRTPKFYSQDNITFFPNKAQRHTEGIQFVESDDSGMRTSVSGSSQRKSGVPASRGNAVSSTSAMDKYKPHPYAQKPVTMRNNWTEKRVLKQNPHLFVEGKSSDVLKMEPKTISNSYNGSRPSTGRKSPPITYTKLKSRTLGIRPRSAEVRVNTSSILKNVYYKKPKAASSTQLDYPVNRSRGKRTGSAVARKTSFSKRIQSAKPVTSYGSNSSIETSKPKVGKRTSFARVQRRSNARVNTTDIHKKKEELQCAHGDDNLKGKASPLSYSGTRRASSPSRPSSGNKKVVRKYVFHETSRTSATHVDNERGQNIADRHALQSAQRKRQVDSKKTPRKPKTHSKTSPYNADDSKLLAKTSSHHNQTPMNKTLKKMKPNGAANHMKSAPSKASFKENNKFEVYMWDGTKSKLVDKANFHLKNGCPSSEGVAAPKKISKSAYVRREPLDTSFAFMQMLYNTPEYQLSLKTRPVRCYYVW